MNVLDSLTKPKQLLKKIEHIEERYKLKSFDFIKYEQLEKSIVTVVHNKELFYLLRGISKDTYDLLYEVVIKEYNYNLVRLLEKKLTDLKKVEEWILSKESGVVDFIEFTEPDYEEVKVEYVKGTCNDPSTILTKEEKFIAVRSRLDVAERLNVSRAEYYYNHIVGPYKITTFKLDINKYDFLNNLNVKDIPYYQPKTFDFNSIESTARKELWEQEINQEEVGRIRDKLKKGYGNV